MKGREKKLGKKGKQGYAGGKEGGGKREEGGCIGRKEDEKEGRRRNREKIGKKMKR